MKHFPRALNRGLLFLLGLLTLSSGIALLLVSYWPSARSTFLTQTEYLNATYRELWEHSLVAIPGQAIQAFSWLDLAWVATAGTLALGCLLWIFQQGGGRAKEIKLLNQKQNQPKQLADSEHSLATTSEQPGEIIAELGFVNDLLQDALSDERWIERVKTTAWQVRKEPGISLSIVAYKGADLAELKAVTQQAIARLDSVLGITIPIAVHITTNWRSSFKSAQRTDS